MENFIIGPTDTPYAGGMFFLSVEFTEDYPEERPEVKFENKIYHLNVDYKYDIGHISLNTLNSWRTTGKVKDKPFYTVKQALFDIFCLFSNQGVDSPYDEEMAFLYINNRE